MSKRDSRIGDAIGDWAAKRVLERLVARTDNVSTVSWLGTPVWQYPLDAWLIQEMISHLRPDVIVETGTYRGGSAWYYATLCDLLEHGEVISVDVAAEQTIPHPRITYLSGSSVDPQVFADISSRVNDRDALVILDSDHSSAHVRKELDLYSALVKPGGYIHVQDAIIDTLSSFTRHEDEGIGPLRAIKDFLSADSAFERDVAVERRYVMTAHSHGWLRRSSLA